jgi:predicted dehydrogenase
MERNLRFAIIGAGFWAPYQLAGWLELSGVELAAVCDINREKAARLAAASGAAVYTDAGHMLREERLDFVDIITSPETHAGLTALVAAVGLPVICQKPMSTDLNTAREMVENCRAAGVPLFIHENFRWQTPIRRFKALMDSGVVGRIFKARVTYCNSYPVFDNQPFLAELEQFILTDIGVHILDVARFLFGEAEALYCLTQRVNPRIKGEDVANVLMRMRDGLHCYTEMSYASHWEHARFPQTYVLAEGEGGAIALGPDHAIRVTSAGSTTQEIATPPLYAWSHLDYALIHSSIVETNRDILRAIRGEGAAETTGEDNLKTLELVYGCYRSATLGKVVVLG